MGSDEILADLPKLGIREQHRFRVFQGTVGKASINELVPLVLMHAIITGIHPRAGLNVVATGANH